MAILRCLGCDGLVLTQDDLKCLKVDCPTNTGEKPQGYRTFTLASGAKAIEIIDKKERKPDGE